MMEDWDQIIFSRNYIVDQVFISSSLANVYMSVGQFLNL